jgi:hypothetical protein
MDRDVIIKIIEKNKVVWRECVSMNNQNRITIHHGLGCIIDEGEHGKLPTEVFNGPFSSLKWTKEPLSDIPESDKLFQTSKLYETLRMIKN